MFVNEIYLYIYIQPKLNQSKCEKSNKKNNNNFS